MGFWARFFGDESEDGCRSTFIDGDVRKGVRYIVDIDRFLKHRRGMLTEAQRWELLLLKQERDMAAQLRALGEPVIDPPPVRYLDIFPRLRAPPQPPLPHTR